jgi:hypothetical protein
MACAQLSLVEQCYKSHSPLATKAFNVFPVFHLSVVFFA